jgi:hypothetical protein
MPTLDKHELLNLIERIYTTLDDDVADGFVRLTRPQRQEIYRALIRLLHERHPDYGEGQ